MRGRIRKQPDVDTLLVQLKFKLKDALGWVIGFQVQPALAYRRVQADCFLGLNRGQGFSGMRVAFCNNQRRMQEKLKQ